MTIERDRQIDMTLFKRNRNDRQHLVGPINDFAFTMIGGKEIYPLGAEIKIDIVVCEVTSRQNAVEKSIAVLETETAHHLKLNPTGFASSKKDVMNLHEGVG